MLIYCFLDVICGPQDTLTRLVSSLLYAIVSIRNKFIKNSGNAWQETGRE